MKLEDIDGYVPADEKVAAEIGIELKYRTRYGEFNIRALSTGKHNVAFKKAAEKLNKRRQIQAKTGFVADSVDAVRDTLEVWHDTVVVSWTTTVKIDGKKIKPSKEAFVDLLSMEAFLGVFTALVEDCGEASNFSKAAEDETAGN